jgi:hypothetical protein
MQQTQDGRRVCAACGCENSRDRNSCERCRQPLASTEADRRRDGGIPLWVVGGALGLLLLAALNLIARPRSAPMGQPGTPPTTTAPAGRSGEAEVNLGPRPVDFGSRGQARELLALIEQQPGRASYSIAYTTDIDVVVFGCDFSKNVLVRVHRRLDNHGSSETWRGYLLDRLRSAAAGGSLNDTPDGESGGTFDTF